MAWQRGRQLIEELIQAGELSIVEESSEIADYLMADAVSHLKLARSGISYDRSGALQLSYDGVRKAAAALLVTQGLRATVSGGHIAVLDAVKAQFNDRGGMQVFGKLHQLRRRRNNSEYPTHLSATVTEHDAQHAINVATEVIQAAQQILDSGKLGRFT